MPKSKWPDILKGEVGNWGDLVQCKTHIVIYCRNNVLTHLKPHLIKGEVAN